MATFDEIINSETPVLVDFTATWCGPCKMMAPILQELKNDLGDKVKIIKIDIDKNRNIAEQMQVQSVPTLMVFKKGQLHWQQSGVQSASVLAQVISKIS
jgi:thioredoxin 1